MNFLRSKFFIRRMTSLASAVSKNVEGFLNFINKSPTAFHCVDNVKTTLTSSGFKELRENEQWNIEPLGKYFVIKNASCIAAFAVGGKYTNGNGFALTATHTDSPHLRVKPVSKREESGYLQVNVECYGGGIWHTWFDRDLTLAGRVFFRKQNDKISQQLVHINRPILRVPTIAIHLKRDTNEKLEINKQDNLQAVLALKTEEELNKSTKKDEKCDTNKKLTESKKHHSQLLELLANECNCQPDDIINFDLMLADTQPSCVGGLNNEFIFSGRLDNQMSAYCAIQGLVNTLDTLPDEKFIRGALLYDNEEIGSESAQGAMSEFTQHTLRRLTRDEYERSVSNSFLVSADMAHAVHPNYSSLHDRDHKPSLSNGGVVVKTNCCNRYATTAFTSTLLKEIARLSDVPLQEFCMRNDMPCGTTVGPILASRLGMYTVDVGAPQLSMHSIREMTSTQAFEIYLEFFKGFYKNFKQIKLMTEENIIPPSEHPVRIRWLNAAEQNATIQKPVAQHPQTPAIKTNKATAPSVIGKAQTKVPSATNVVRFVDQPAPTNSVDMSIQSSKGIKELSPEDKLKIANLIKELARVGHEKELVESKLEQERKLFEGQMKTLLTDYDKLMKDNQKLLTRYNQTKTMLSEYEKKSQISSRSTTNEFPNPQRSSTPINLHSKESSTIRIKSENDLIQSSRTANSILNEQFQLKQLMMEKQLELLNKQQQILEKEFQQKNANSSIEQPSKSSITQTTTRATSPIKRELKINVIERATSPVKQPTTTIIKTSDKKSNRPIQTQRYGIDHNEEDLLILSLNESLNEQIPKQISTNKKSQVKKNPSTSITDSEEQNLLKDIFFIC